MVEVSEFIFSIFHSSYYSRKPSPDGTMLVHMWVILSKATRGKRKWEISTTDGCADMEGELTSDTRGPDFDPVLDTLFCT